MYELPVHRYRELKHFCLQYHDMKEELLSLSRDTKGNSKSDVTSAVAIKMTDLTYATELIETTAKDTSYEYGDLILKAVTEDVCLSELDFDNTLLHKFFFLLSERKGV